MNRFDCRVHKCTWGHSATIDVASREETGEITYVKAHGHLSPSVGVGDEIIFSFERGPVLAIVVEVRNMMDPRDQWFGKVRLERYLNDAEVAVLDKPKRGLPQLRTW